MLLRYYFCDQRFLRCFVFSRTSQWARWALLRTGISHCQPQSSCFLLGWCWSHFILLGWSWSHCFLLGWSRSSCFLLGWFRAVVSCLDGVRSSCFLLGWCASVLALVSSVGAMVVSFDVRYWSELHLPARLWMEFILSSKWRYLLVFHEEENRTNLR